MPIHINLLAESQAAEEMRRRDPAKRFIFICASIVVIVLMVSAWLASGALLAKERLNRLQQDVDAQTNVYQQVKLNLMKIAAAKNKLAQLDNLSTNRFLEGNLLDVLQHATVENVQLTSLRLEQNYQINRPDAPEGKPAPPARSTETIVLHLTAKDFSPNPGDQINKFKDTIAQQPYFQRILDKTNAVQLTGPPSPVQTDESKPYVLFSIDYRFAPNTR